MATTDHPQDGRHQQIAVLDLSKLNAEDGARSPCAVLQTLRLDPARFSGPHLLGVDGASGDLYAALVADEPRSTVLRFKAARRQGGRGGVVFDARRPLDPLPRAAAAGGAAAAAAGAATAGAARPLAGAKQPPSAETEVDAAAVAAAIAAAIAAPTSAPTGPPTAAAAMVMREVPTPTRAKPPPPTPTPTPAPPTPNADAVAAAEADADWRRQQQNDRKRLQQRQQQQQQQQQHKQQQPGASHLSGGVLPSAGAAGAASGAGVTGRVHWGFVGAAFVASMLFAARRSGVVGGGSGEDGTAFRGGGGSYGAVAAGGGGGRRGLGGGAVELPRATVRDDGFRKGADGVWRQVAVAPPPAAAAAVDDGYGEQGWDAVGGADASSGPAPSMV